MMKEGVNRINLGSIVFRKSNWMHSHFFSSFCLFPGHKKDLHTAMDSAVHRKCDG